MGVHVDVWYPGIKKYKSLLETKKRRQRETQERQRERIERQRDRGCHFSLFTSRLGFRV